MPGATLVTIESVGPITRFVQKNYYLVDCSVTLVVGLLSLTLLIKNNHAPDSGFYWYTAFGAGIGLGLLTNSDC
jgi:4-amino-4-deoxy-L-arabinose transferase-like glycosyltransferase